MKVRIWFVYYFILLISFLPQSSWPAADDLITRPIQFVAISETQTPPFLDGQLTDSCWSKSRQLTDFQLTAGNHGQPAQHQTICYVTYNETHLYVAFKCIEPNISEIKANTKMWDDPDILFDDRVEIFLDVNHDHRSYIELAVNPQGFQFDQSGFNRLHGSKTCDMEPRWNCFWRAKTHIGRNDWTAEIALDVTSLGIPRIENGMTWGFNLARVRQPDVKPGDEFFKREPAGEAEYSAWVPVKDYIRETISNFHAPLEFGDLVFGDPDFKITGVQLRSALYAFGPVGNPSRFGWNPLNLQIEPGKRQPALLALTVTPPSVEKWEQTESVALTTTKIETQYYLPEDLENHIEIKLLDPQTKQHLYRATYIEIAPPFIEFDLEPLYTRKPAVENPVRFRLLTDSQTLSEAELELKFYEMKTKHVIATAYFKDVSTTFQFTSVFENDKLRALPGDEYFIECILTNKVSQKRLAKFRQNLTKFEPDLPPAFSVEAGDYSYGGITDHAIRIRYPFAAEFVFWRQSSYIPWWDVEQAAMTNEFIECWGGGNQGCCEPMQDRECRYSRVELLESSPARAVVHWRYALSDPHYKIYFNEWVDEYYTLYPDGVGVRQVNLWPNSNSRHEMFEALLAKPPGVQTEQLFDEKFATLSNLDGEGYSNKYFNEHRAHHQEFIKKSKDLIVEIHFKDRLHPFTAFSMRPDLMPGVTPEHITVCARVISSADRRGHWPASRYQIDGYNTVGLDVPHHGNIGNVQAEVNANNQPTTWTFLIGVTEEGSPKPYQHTKSWLYPAKIQMLTQNCRYQGYDYAQRAYVIQVSESAKTCQMKFTETQSPVVNPVFVIQHESRDFKQAKIDQQQLNPDQIKTGKTRKGAIILFLNETIHKNQMITIDFKE